MSQDNVFHNMEGLALVAKLVGEESVSGIPVTFINTTIPDRLTRLGIQNGSTISFSLWAQDFVKRYIKYIQSWGEYSKSIGFPFNVSVSTHWIIGNPVTTNLVEEGSGSDLDLGMYYHVGVIKTGEQLTGQNLRIYGGILGSDAFTEVFNNHTITTNSNILDFIISKFSDNMDDYKVRSLACNSDISGYETYNKLRYHRDNYRPDGKPLLYEHFPLMYLSLHNPVVAMDEGIYNSDQTYYESLLNKAPECGPTSDGVYEWSSTSRCVWPENNGKNSNKYIAYSGTDYMMLHNLYYIAYKREGYKSLSISTNYTNQTVTAHAGIIEANNIVQGGDVTYTAINNIKLKQGFHVSQGNLKAKIKTNNYDANTFRMITTTKCKCSRLKSSITEKKSVNSSEFFEVQKEKKGESLNNDEELFIYPNPCNGKFNINLRNMELPIKYEVTNITGTLKKKGIVFNITEIIDISSLPSGLYLVYFYSENKTLTKKINVIH